MFRSSKYAALITALLLVGYSPAHGALRVTKIYDGDTVTMADGMKVRLLQIDAPELAEGECYADKAKSQLVSLLAMSG